MILVVIVPVFFCSAVGGGFGEAGNVEILRFPAQGLQLEDEGSRAESDAPGGLGPLIHARRAQIDEAVKQAVDALGRNAAVQDIDHAADCIAAIGDGCRPAQDFNAARAEHFAGYGMVRAGRGSVHGGEPVDENRDAILAQAADDGTARGRAEIARIHTGQSLQRIGDVAAEQLHQPLLGEHGHRADDLIGLKAQGRRGHGDHIRLLSNAGVRRRLGERRRGVAALLRQCGGRAGGGQKRRGQGCGDKQAGQDGEGQRDGSGLLYYYERA